MARSTLPRHARTSLLAVGFRKDGRPIWPILGGSEPAGEPTPADPPAPAELSWDELRAQFEEQGLNPGQIRGRLDASRKWEDRAKSVPKPDELAALREKAEQFDVLAAASQTDQERAISEASQTSRLIAEAEFMPRLVAAEFRVAAAGRLEPDRLATILEPLDLSKFLTDDGDIDTDKVSAFVDGIAPARGTEPQRLGPSSGGAGRRGSYTPAASSVASGRELYESMHPRKS